MTSIRLTLSRGLVFGLVALLAVIGFTLFFVGRTILVAEFDYALMARANALMSLSEIKARHLELEQIPPEYRSGTEPVYFQFWRRGGKCLLRSPSLQGGDLPRPNSSPEFRDITLPNGRAGRAVGVDFVPDHDEDDASIAGVPSDPFFLSLVVARSGTRLSKALSYMLVALATTGLLALFLAWLLVRNVVGIGLRPLAQLANEIESVDSGSLDLRFSAGDKPSELAPVIEQFNSLLGRLEEAFGREKRLTADIAHELYTPIAEMRSCAEVALSWPSEPGALHNLALNTREIAEHMQGIVAALLSLARCEAGTQQISKEKVDVAGLLNLAREALKGRLQTKELNLRWSVPNKAEVETDRTLLRSILQNLLNNAVEYSPAGAVILCELKEQGQSLVFTMTNPNPGLVEEDLKHFFEPTWQKSKVSISSPHMGLGLSVVRRFSDLLGFTVRAELVDNDRLKVHLVIR